MFIKIAKHSCKWFLAVSALLIIAFAFLISVTRIALPFIRHKNNYAAHWLSEVLNKPVGIKLLTVSWRGFDPVLNFTNVIVRNSQHDARTALKVHKVSVSVNLFKSLLHGKLLPGLLVISGSQVDLYQTDNKHFQIKGIVDVGGKKQKTNFVYLNSLFSWLLSQSQVSMSDIQIHLYLLSGHEMTLRNLMIKTNNVAEKHQLLFKAQLGAAGLSHMRGVFNINHIDLNLDQFDATGYVSAKQVSLSTWFNSPLFTNMLHKTNVKQGVGDVQTWARWQHGDLQSWHSVIQTKKVALTLPNKNDVMISALHMNLYWQRLLAGWRLSANQINMNQLQAKLGSRSIFIHGVKGRFYLSPGEFGFSADTHKMQVAGLHSWNHPLQFQRVSLSAEMRQKKSGWHVVAPRLYIQKNNLVANGALSLDVPKQGSPIINGFFIFKLNSLAHVYSLFPTNRIHPKLNAWFSHAFTAGSVPYGLAIVHGPLNDFPFRDHHGVFRVGMQLKNVGLHYAPKWPDLNNLSGKLVFSDDGMKVVDATASVQKMKVSQVNASIAHWKKSLLMVDAKSQLSLANGFHFLKNMPLSSAKTFDAFSPTGKATLHLHLQLPLKKSNKKKRVSGNVITQAAVLPLPQWGLTLNQLKGRFTFTGNALSSEYFTAAMNGQPLSATLSTINRQKVGHALLFNLAGSLDAAKIEKRFSVSNLIASKVTGNLRYRALMTVGLKNKERGHVSLHLMSDLLGLQSELPEGLNKNIGQASLFNLHMQANDAHHISLGVQFDHTLKTKLVLEKQKQHWAVSKMQVQLKKNKVFNGFFSRLRARWFLIKDNGVLTLKGSHVAGRCYVPRDINHPWYCDLSTLRVPSFHLNNNPQSIDPNKIPPMRFSIDHLYMGKKALGAFSVQWKKIKNGLQVSSLELHNPHFILMAKGSWQQDGKKIKTQFNGKLGTGDWGNLLGLWRVTHALLGGSGWLNFSLNWNDSPFGMAIKKLNGNLSVNLNRGRIVKLSAKTESKLGLGKLLNLLSFESLPMNIFSGFSLLNKKGFAFDELKGPMTLSHGVVNVKDLKLNGPLAWIDAHGKVAILRKRYNMFIHVSPNITSSLPLIVGLVGGPVAGVVAWVADKVVAARLVGKIASSTKHVVGSWAQPKITKVSNAKTKA